MRVEPLCLDGKNDRLLNQIQKTHSMFLKRLIATQWLRRRKNAGNLMLKNQRAIFLYHYNRTSQHKSLPAFDRTLGPALFQGLSSIRNYHSLLLNHNHSHSCIGNHRDLDHSLFLLLHPIYPMGNLCKKIMTTGAYTVGFHFS